MGRPKQRSTARRNPQCQPRVCRREEHGGPSRPDFIMYIHIRTKKRITCDTHQLCSWSKCKNVSQLSDPRISINWLSLYHCSKWTVCLWGRYWCLVPRPRDGTELTLCTLHRSKRCALAKSEWEWETRTCHVEVQFVCAVTVLCPFINAYVSVTVRVHPCMCLHVSACIFI